MFFCKLNEQDGFDIKKTAKPCGITIKVPEWVSKTEGTCTFSSKKQNDLERHLLGVHSLKFRDFAYHCTHCENVFVDRGRANAHMDSCSNLKRWATECREKFPIHSEFLDRFSYWTADKTVLSKRPKQKTVFKNERDIAKEKYCQDLINGKGVAGNAFKEVALSTSSVDVEVMEIDDVPKDIIAVYDVEEDTESITTFAATTVVETKDLEEDEVIKTEIAEDDFL